jgi:two-component system, chemotaxis family, CheB/CheR fusion protein
MSTRQEPDPAFEQLLTYLRDERGFDFTGYKRPSLMRRITKRMDELGISSFGDYQTYLASHEGEFVDLFNTILINVTSFFRDDGAWEYLRDEIVPRIVQEVDGSPKDQIRIWSTGCASGEEAFTTAMVFAEEMGEEAFRQRVKIYATDIDEDALTKGRHGEYTSKEIEPVPPDFRERYFERVNSNYTFRPDLRRSVIFGRHDLVQDPPISKISLLLSRNTLMYFDTETQKRILANFHFSLRDDSFLFLGKSEALAATTDLFAAVDLKRRVFAKLPGKRPPRLDAQIQPRADTLSRLASETMIRDAGFEAVPLAQIVVDRQGVLALANMQARAFFGIAPTDIGRPFQDLEISFRPVELRSRMEQVYAERHLISLRDVEWRVDGETRYVDVQITPLVASTGEIVGVGVTLADVTRYRRLQDALEESKREMETAYEELQSTVEELETTNEELQSTNEELETTNEELQSTNEELETMNEELQSTNEELETMNDELNDRSIELNQANAFLGTVLTSLQAGVVVVNTELIVQAWNAGARELWGLTPDEVVGRHLLNLDIGLPLDQVQKPVREALSGDGGGSRELVLEAVNRRGRDVIVRVGVTPLSDDGGAVHGVILLMQPDGEKDG